MNKNTNIVIGTWSWSVGGFAGGDTIFGNNLDTKQLIDVIDLALKNGINIFDTAYAYANGESERILGELLKPYDRNSYKISDKFTPQMANPNTENPMLEMLTGSLNRLQEDFIDIYWIHNSSDIEKWTPYLKDAVDTGKIGRIGVSNHNLSQVKRVQEILSPLGLQISAVQNHFSLLYRASIEDGLLEYCKENQIEFFSYMILEQGVLSGKYDKNNLLPENSNRGQRYNHLFEKLDTLISELRNLAKKYNATPAQIATRWAIEKGTTPIIGITSIEQVEDVIKVKNLNLKKEEIGYLDKLAIESGVNTKGGWEGVA